ncbi:hypothetical protein EMIHUDRAFT_449765 [Emiliania huxleyi CCMP1516]|uniref:Protein kinase domain-containing protein n=2 Tax=Emiliania huxleyi TaxID=2903 RepID=A0A0D3K2W4_EMIH1|nr:hypothetical protein EMIHUDRAFT_449765 [Emiliania huxleyi CCMP1516]EOD30099.1 hypothetical protein EMIHUDRAFT_449765 [Emiliania huxleyi CCMP1516]|eukprot:XP_005782528.1 hypothetical protein EMIHUDRAFT_449765 [Emiliania huxleyi CCMP1516]
MSAPGADADEIVERSPDGRYVRFRQTLGVGAFKSVYKAYDEEEAPHPPCALALTGLAAPGGSGYAAGIEVAWCQVMLDRADEAVVAQIYKEVEILKGLNHKHILQFYTYFNDMSDKAKHLVFITEIMTSGTLKQYIAKAKRVKRKVVKKWCRQILEGMTYLHSNQIIHRDLKCDNIFINGNNSEIKIGDLGLSTLMRDAPAQSVLGTPEFMAPELYDEEYNEKVDIYAFGMSVLEMVTSEYPYSECNNAAQIYRKVTQGTKPGALDKIRDEQTRAFIDLCLMHDHKQRPAAAELLEHEWLRMPFGGAGSDDDKPDVDKAPAAPLASARSQPASHAGGSRHSIDLTHEPSTSNEIELTCSVMLDGETKTVTFQMDPVNDTAEAVADEMVEELELDRSDGTREDIISQVNDLLNQRRAQLLSGSVPVTRANSPPEARQDVAVGYASDSAAISRRHHPGTFDISGYASDSASLPLPPEPPKAHSGSSEADVNAISPAASVSSITEQAAMGHAYPLAPAASQPTGACGQAMPGAPAMLPNGRQPQMPPQQPMGPPPPVQMQPPTMQHPPEGGMTRAATAPGAAMQAAYAQTTAGYPGGQQPPPHHIDGSSSMTSLPPQGGLSMQGSQMSIGMAPSPGEDEGDDGDEEDLELMRSIEKQQKKEMEQMLAKHAQQNDRMKKMIKERRAKEKQDQKRAELTPRPIAPSQAPMVMPQHMAAPQAVPHPQQWPDLERKPAPTQRPPQQPSQPASCKADSPPQASARAPASGAEKPPKQPAPVVRRPSKNHDEQTKAAAESARAKEAQLMDQISCGLGTKNELGKLKGVNGSSDCLSSMPSSNSAPPKPGGMNASSTTAKQMSEAQARGLEQELGLGGGVAGGAR